MLGASLFLSAVVQIAHFWSRFFYTHTKCTKRGFSPYFCLKNPSAEVKKRDTAPRATRWRRRAKKDVARVARQEYDGTAEAKMQRKRSMHTQLKKHGESSQKRIPRAIFHSPARSKTGMISSGAATVTVLPPFSTSPVWKHRHVPVGRYTSRSRIPAYITGATR